MRTRQEIKSDLTNAFIQNEYMIQWYGLDSSKTFDEQFSIVSFENTLLSLFAFYFWTQEMLFGQHKTEVTEIIALLKPHTLRWYRAKALDFQYGFDLIEDTDVFNNGTAAQEEISQSKIIKYSAVTEAVTESRLIIKIATEDNAGELSPISTVEKQSFEAYIAEIKDAGVRITVINYLPDILRLQLKIFYDPLVLTPDGVLIRNPSIKPVEKSLKEYMKELPFNGELVLASLIDKLQLTEGVKIPHLVNAATKWIDENGITYGNFENIYVTKIPISGYFKIEDFLNIEYVPYNK